MNTPSIMRTLKSPRCLKSMLSLIFIFSAFLSACSADATPSYIQGTNKVKVLVAETFLADITRNVTGERADVISLLPLDLDPHSFEATPQDVVLINESDVLILNGSGLEEWLDPILKDLPSELKIVEASAGLIPRQPGAEEIVDEEFDPHFWLDPTMVVRYVENIRDAMISVDPTGKDIYTKNAADYIAKLEELDAWIKTEIDTIPAERRLMVTNHESFGYYADRYGLKIIGTILPSVSTGASPSARHMADLVNLIKENNAPAIFLETGVNPELADQLASETDVKVVTNIYSHSVTESDGPAPTYLDMIRKNTETFVSALK